MQHASYIDFETRSDCDLKACGARVYAAHPSTDVLAIGYCVPGTAAAAPVTVIRPDAMTRNAPPADLAALLCDPAVAIVAHNAAFDRAIYEAVCVGRWDWPSVDRSRWRCTMSACLQRGIPAGLDNAAAALGLTGKDKAGARTMLALCKPTGKAAGPKPARYRMRPGDADALALYCAQDVRTMIEIARVLAGPAAAARGDLLTGGEQLIYDLDQRINDRGFAVDLDLCRAAISMMRDEVRDANATIARLTGGAATAATQTQAIAGWLRSRGVALDGIAKREVADLLAAPELDADAREVLTCRQRVAKSSTAKYSAFLASAGTDGRVRGTMRYHGAGPGRWSGQGAQPQNLPRGEVKIAEADVEPLIAAVKRGDVEAVRARGTVGQVLSALIRSVIIAPPGRQLVACDYSAVEACGALWFAGENAALETLRTGGGGLLYKDMAATIYDVAIDDVTPDQRWVGKTAILGLGYGMGVPKFAATCSGFGRPVSDELAARTVDAYRAKFPGIPAAWRAIEAAALRAMRTGGSVEVGRVLFVLSGDRRWLVCALPSGRPIYYYQPEINADGALTYMTTEKGKFVRVKTWGGKLFENIIQGLCADLLRNALQELPRLCWRPVLTVHDEIVCESVEGTVERMAEIMTRLPSWAEGFPLTASGWRGPRFKKD